MPRPLVKSGLPGIGQDIFPDSAREQGRRVGLVGDARLLIWTPTTSGGATKNEWAPQTGTVRARLDPTGGGASGVRGGAVNESTTHIITFENGQVVSSKDRVRMNGMDWIITASLERTEELVKRVEVRQV
jgi:hypothetical protein